MAESRQIGPIRARKQAPEACRAILGNKSTILELEPETSHATNGLSCKSREFVASVSGTFVLLQSTILPSCAPCYDDGCILTSETLREQSVWNHKKLYSQRSTPFFPLIPMASWTPFAVGDTAVCWSLSRLCAASLLDKQTKRTIRCKSTSVFDLK